MMLGTALDRDWLRSLPILHKVICFQFVPGSNTESLTFNLSFLCC